MLRRRLVAAGGIYASAALGIAGSLIVFRVLGPTSAGEFSIVLGTMSFVSLVLELTSDEALVKFGFRYAAREDWGRFRRIVHLTFMFEAAAAVVSAGLIVLLSFFADSIFNGAGDLRTPMLVASAIPVLETVEVMGAAMLILHGRYDIRGLLLMYSMALRLAGLAVGAMHGVTAAVLGLVAAQALTSATTGSIGLAALRRFPAAPSRHLDEDRPLLLKFVLQSSLDTGLISLRTWLAPLTLGIVRNATDMGLFRAAQTPQTGLAVLSAPVRMIMLTDQTRDWERNRPEHVFAGLRRYILGSAAAMVVLLPPLIWATPFLVRLLLGHRYLPAVDATRLILASAAIQLVFGWTKSFAVTIGRPDLRLVAHAIETAVLLALIVVFGKLWGVTGAAAAFVIASAVHAAVWSVLFVHLRREYEPVLNPST